MEAADEKCCLYFYDLQSRNIPEASFPDGYTLHTWQDGAENVWLDIVTKAFEPGFLTAWKTETFIQRYFIKPQFHKDGFFLVKYDNNFIATAFAWQEEEVSSQGKLHWLAVLPEHRGKGIAQALCYHVLQYFKDHGKNMVMLRTEVYRDKAIQLYKKIGFANQSNYLRYYRKPQFKEDGFFLIKYGGEYIATAIAWEDDMLWKALVAGCSTKTSKKRHWKSTLSLCVKLSQRQWQKFCLVEDQSHERIYSCKAII